MFEKALLCLAAVIGAACEAVNPGTVKLLFWQAPIAIISHFL